MGDLNSTVTCIYWHPFQRLHSSFSFKEGEGIKARQLRRFGKLKSTHPANCSSRNPWSACGLWLPQSTRMKTRGLRQLMDCGHSIQRVDCGSCIAAHGLRQPYLQIWLPQSTSRNPWAELHSTSLIAAAGIHNDAPQLEPFYTVP